MYISQSSLPPSLIFWMFLLLQTHYWFFTYLSVLNEVLNKLKIVVKFSWSNFLSSHPKLSNLFFQ